MVTKQSNCLMNRESIIPKRVNTVDQIVDSSLDWLPEEPPVATIQEKNKLFDCESIKVALFIDSRVGQDGSSALPGIHNNAIAEFSWLRTYDDPISFRKELSKAISNQYAWIVCESSSDGLNLAAALKKDVPARKVYLCCAQGSGSLFSRCKNAGVEPVFGQEAFEQLVDDMRYINLTHLGFGAPKSTEENLLEISNHAANIINSTDVVDVVDATEAQDAVDKVTKTDVVDVVDVTDIKDKASDPLYDNYILDDYINQELLSAQTALRQSEIEYSDNAWSNLFETSNTSDPYFDYDAYYGLGSSVQTDVFEDYIDRTSVVDTEDTYPGVSGSSNTYNDRLVSYPTTKQIDSGLSHVSQSHKSFVMTIVSGSGGTGKSSIALFSAILLQMRGKRTLLLDGNLQFGDLNYLVGEEEPITLLDIMEHPERIQSLKSTDMMPAYIAAPPRLEQSELMFTTLPQTIEQMREHFDAIVINTGCCWSDEHVGLLKISNCSLFIMDQRPTSIKTCNHALEFCARAGIPMQNFFYVLNFSSKQSLITPMDVSCALQGVTVYELADGGDEVGELMSAGQSEELIASGNAFTESLKTLMLELVPGLEPAPGESQPKKRKRRFLKKSA